MFRNFAHYSCNDPLSLLLLCKWSRLLIKNCGLGVVFVNHFPSTWSKILNLKISDKWVGGDPKLNWVKEFHGLPYQQLPRIEFWWSSWMEGGFQFNINSYIRSETIHLYLYFVGVQCAWGCIVCRFNLLTSRCCSPTECCL